MNSIIRSVMTSEEERAIRVRARSAIWDAIFYEGDEEPMNSEFRESVAMLRRECWRAHLSLKDLVPDRFTWKNLCFETLCVAKAVRARLLAKSRATGGSNRGRN